MFNALKFFNPSYLFKMNPMPLSPAWKWTTVVVLGLMIVAAVVIWLWGRRSGRDIFAKRVARKLTTLLAMMGVSGWILWFFREYRVYFLGMRFLALLLILGVLVWAWQIYRYISKKVSVGRLQVSEQSLYEKYLPRKKK